MCEREAGGRLGGGGELNVLVGTHRKKGRSDSEPWVGG